LCATKGENATSALLE